jgi:hypothetical protein
LSPTTVALLVLVCSFGSAVVGMQLRRKLPVGHLDSGSQDVVKLVMGLIATMSALVLSLVIASTNANYQQLSTELKGAAADIILQDRTLALYGPEAKASRDALHDIVRDTHDRVWSPRGVRPENLDSAQMRSAAKSYLETLQSLSPRTDMQRMLLTRALQDAETISRSRIMMFEQVGSSVSWPFMMVLIIWICMLFLGFGLLAPANATVTMTLLVGSFAVASAIFLIMEASDPYRGLMRISDQPLRAALAQIDR